VFVVSSSFLYLVSFLRLFRVFFCFHCGQNFIQPVVILFQRFAEHGQPLVHRVNAGLGQAAWALGAVDSLDNEARFFEHLQVLGDGGLRHLERLCQFHDRGFSAGETRQDGAPGGVGEGGEGRVQVEAE
jgi:hypothetical protein